MLPRVSAALSQFISPILNATQKPGADQRKEQKFARFQATENVDPDQRKQDPPVERLAAPHLKLVSNLPEKIEVPEAIRKASSVSNTFLNIFNLLKLGRSPVVWLGHRAYQTAELLRKSGSRFRKGTMLDRKAE